MAPVSTETTLGFFSSDDLGFATLDLGVRFDQVDRDGSPKCITMRSMTTIIHEGDHDEHDGDHDDEHHDEEMVTSRPRLVTRYSACDLGRQQNAVVPSCS